MGCALSTNMKSQSRVAAASDSETPVKQSTPSENSLSKPPQPKGKVGTRVRRLSYVTYKQDGEAPSDQESPSPQRREEKSNSKNVRARRLSYVGVNSEKANNGDFHDSPNDASIQNGTLQENDPRSLICTISSISKAGRETGYNKTNQDSYFAFSPFAESDMSLFGAFDGHGPNGHQVSGFVQQHMPGLVSRKLFGGQTVAKALHQSFLEVDKKIQTSNIDAEFSGTTAVVGLLQERTLTVAWVGDSKCVLGRQESNSVQAVEISRDHKPMLPEEKARILQQGGRVDRLSDDCGQPVGPHRVWLSYAWLPGLAMSRALGDLIAHQVGVISEPETNQITLKTADKFVIFASDGIWEFISPQEAVSIVSKYSNAAKASKELVDIAFDRWMVEEDGVVDDITAVVVFLSERQEEVHKSSDSDKN